MNSKVQRFFIIATPFLVGIALAVGIWVGDRLGGKNPNVTRKIFRSSIDEKAKLQQVINYIEEEYVDSVDANEVTQGAIEYILNELDPHSYYIPNKEMQQYTEPLEGNFEGIGVQFMIQKDTVVVVTPISGGPSESLGIRSGDRIVKVEGENIAGTGIKNKDVIDLLRGEKGTTVQVTIYRKATDELLKFDITRGKIPIHSVDIGYMVEDKTGYVKVNRFAKTTHEEFLEKTDTLLSQGMENLVLDLRGNGGGYLQAAIDICDEFLKEGELIVFTQGKAHPKREYFASEKGSLHDVEVAVLIDQGSASASEIVAGALQDNDRGLVIGRRSFGKGLVQEHIKLGDGGALRLTVARYYTPTGRCIQKPYGEEIDYHKDLTERLSHGELYNADSIEFPDSLRYETEEGKVVYGGGGIMPDIFVPLDTANVTDYYSALTYRGVLSQFAFDYADAHRQELNEFGSPGTYRQEFRVSSSLLEELRAYAEEKDMEPAPEQFRRSKQLISQRLKALIGRNIWNDEGYYPIMLEDDESLERALKAFQKEEPLEKEEIES